MSVALAVALLSSPAALAWGHHYLVTERALQHEATAWTTAVEVEVESIEALLAADGDALARAIDDHYAWLMTRDGDRWTRQVLDPQGGDRRAFLSACRLNPGAGLPLVVRVPPGDDAPGFPVAPEAASPYLHYKAPLRADVHAVREGQRLPASAVLATYSDEPDWGLDHELWGYATYGYGEQPFGKPQGESSKAPFHMQFDHENVLTRAATDLDEAMVPERIDLFLRLSRAAFATGHDYWGLRFAAWATHYAQDLAQPYHARAVPGARLGWYLSYLLSGDKERIEAETTQLAANRHFVYEDLVAYGLQQARLGETTGPGGADLGRLVEALGTGPALLGDGRRALDAGSSASALVDALTGPASAHAWTIDDTIRRAFPARLTEDPTYDVETAPDYDITAVLAEISPDAGAALLEETAQDFAQAGAATRTVLELVGARAALQE